MRYLVDTCVLSELIEKQPFEPVVSWIREQDELSLFVSVLTFGEIEKGLAKLDDEKRRQRLRNRVDHDLKRHSTDGAHQCISTSHEPMPAR